MNLKAGLYVLALLTSALCALLLLRGWWRFRQRMLFWSAVCFVFLSFNNVLLILDLLVFPRVDLRLWRLVTALAGVISILCAFILEED